MTVRKHFTKHGRPKSGFERRADAVRAAERYSRGSVRFLAYKCDWPGCGRYHIGRG